MFDSGQLIFLVVFVRSMKCEMEPKIVGGEYVSIRNFPHSVFLNAECMMTWICGASVLNQWILLTAAHCLEECDFKKEKKHTINAFMGHEDLRKVQITRAVKDFIQHEKYDEESVENDIGLAYLKETIQFSDTVKRIIISKTWPNARSAYVAGWGLTNETTHDTGTRLKVLSQKIRSHAICDTIGYLSPDMFCAGSTIGEDPHPAAGDSGSAFVYKESLQIGLVSFKVQSQPALMVYSNVTYFYSWIMKHAEVLYCSNQKLKIH